MWPPPPGIFVIRYVPGSKVLIKSSKFLARFSYGSYTLCTIRYDHHETFSYVRFLIRYGCRTKQYDSFRVRYFSYMIRYDSYTIRKSYAYASHMLFLVQQYVSGSEYIPVCRTFYFEKSYTILCSILSILSICSNMQNYQNSIFYNKIDLRITSF